LTLNEITEDFGGFWRRLAGDSQLRWLGPEKGVVHLALAAIVNAVWDLYAKAERKPVWKVLADMTPKQLVSCIDFRYITDVLSPEEAFEMLDRQARTKAVREAELLKIGYPAYTTSAGWIGYSDDGIRKLVREAIAEGWNHFKVKVGGAHEDDERRVALVREEIGPERTLMIDAWTAFDSDPLLPPEFLPEDWPGTTAQNLIADRYARWLPAASRYWERCLSGS